MMCRNEASNLPTEKTYSTSELIDQLYDELKRLAVSKMSSERTEHTLAATGLLHEAFLRLGRDAEIPKWSSTDSFVSAAAETMRRILINHARDRNTIKRGREWSRISSEILAGCGVDADEKLVELNDAFQKLETRDVESAEIAKLRIFANMSIPEIVALTGHGQRTVERRWAFARSWLCTCLS